MHDAATTVSKKQLQSVNIAVELHNQQRGSRRAQGSSLLQGGGGGGGGGGAMGDGEIVEQLQEDVGSMKDEMQTLRQVMGAILLTH